MMGTDRQTLPLLELLSEPKIQKATNDLNEVQPLCLRPWRMSWGWPQSMGRQVRSGPYHVAVPFTKKHLAVPNPCNT